MVSLPLDFFPIGESGKSNGATTYSTCAATSSCSRHQSNTGTHRNGQAKSEESWYLNVRVSHELNQSSIINHQSLIHQSSNHPFSELRTSPGRPSQPPPNPNPPPFWKKWPQSPRISEEPLQQHHPLKLRKCHQQ